jgi:hypothetical protein
MFDHFPEAQAIIRTAYQREDAVVIDPHDEDGRKARDESEVRWPHGAQRCCQGMVTVERSWHLDVEDEQRDRNGEYGIAERLDPSGFVRQSPQNLIIGRGFQGCVRMRASSRRTSFV